MGQSVTLVDGHGVGDAVTGVEHDTGGSAGRVQREHGLDGHVHGGGVEGLEHDLRHLLPVGLGVEGGLGQQNGVLLGGHSQLVVEGVVPDLWWVGVCVCVCVCVSWCKQEKEVVMYTSDTDTGWLINPNYILHKHQRSLKPMHAVCTNKIYAI